MTQHFIFSHSAGALIEVRPSEVETFRAIHDFTHWQRTPEAGHTKPLRELKRTDAGNHEPQTAQPKEGAHC